MEIACPNCFYELSPTTGQAGTLVCDHCGHSFRTPEPGWRLGLSLHGQFLWSVLPTVCSLGLLLVARVGMSHHFDAKPLFVIGFFGSPLAALFAPITVAVIGVVQDRRSGYPAGRLSPCIFTIVINIVMVVVAGALFARSLMA